MRLAIIGGGISGIYLAWKLSEKGNDVVIFERKREIGNSACSGLFSERILEFIPQSRELVLNRIDSALINFPRKKIKLNFSKDFLIMSHAELDQMVAGLAQKAGARIILNQNINRIPEGFDRVIGCDGPLSFVRKLLNLPNPKFKLGILGFINKVEVGHLPYVESWALKQGGFIWKIPRGERVEYGIMAEPKNAKKIFDKFLGENKIILTDLQSKLIPSGLILPRNKEITLCGDATGLTKPWSGGGVIWQLGMADLLIKTFPDFKKYCRLANKMFKFKLIGGKTAVNLIYFLGFNFPFLLPKENKIESDYLINDPISSCNNYRRK